MNKPLGYPEIYTPKYFCALFNAKTAYTLKDKCRYHVYLLRKNINEWKLIHLTLGYLGSRRRFTTWWGAWHPPLKIRNNASIGLKFSRMVYSTTLNMYTKKKIQKSQFNPMMTPQNPFFTVFSKKLQ